MSLTECSCIMEKFLEKLKNRVGPIYICSRSERTIVAVIDIKEIHCLSNFHQGSIAFDIGYTSPRWQCNMNDLVITNNYDAAKLVSEVSRV